MTAAVPRDIRRALAGRVAESLLDTRVVGVVGPRQAGKSTLVQHLVARDPGAAYVTLDDLETRAAAASDPAGFVDGRPGLLAIDEVQRVPDLLLAIKAAVDRDQRPGRFLVTGSSQLSANRDVSETLTGRIERLTLWPLAQAEIEGASRNVVDVLLAGGPFPEGHGADLTKRDYLDRALRGGFPEARTRPTRRREAWFDAYVETVVEREAPGVSASPRTADLPRLLRLVAARHTGLLNVADLAADAHLPRTSLLRYLDILEAVFLTVRIPAWSPNLTQREVRAPKVYVVDSGLAAHLREVGLDDLVRPELARGADGPVVEGLVAAEVLRQAGWADGRTTVSHYRDRNGAEVDLVLERRGRVAAIEVKAGAAADAASARHLLQLRDQLGDRFMAGVVLHTGQVARRLGDRIWSLPIDFLWTV